MRDINAFDPLPMTLGAKVEAPKEQPVSPLVAFEKGDHTPYHCGGVLTVVGYAVGKHFAPSFGSSNGCIGGAVHGPDMLPVPVVYEYESMPYRAVFSTVPADSEPVIVSPGCTMSISTASPEKAAEADFKRGCVVTFVSLADCEPRRLWWDDSGLTD